MNTFNIPDELENFYCHNLTDINLSFKRNFTEDYLIQYFVNFKLNEEAFKDVNKTRDFIDLNWCPEILVIDTIVDYDNLNSPLEQFFESHGGVPLNFDTYLLLEIKISNLEFSSDENWLINAPKKESKNIIDYAKEFSLFIRDRNIKTGIENNLADIHISPSKRNYIIKRKYLKLPEFLAGVSGLLSQVFILLFIYFSFFNHRGAEQKLMQKTLKINSNKHSRLDYLVELFSKVEQNKLNNSNKSNSCNKIESETVKEKSISSILNTNPVRNLIKDNSISDLKENDISALDKSSNKSNLSVSKIEIFSRNSDRILKPIDPEIYIYPVSFSENQNNINNSFTIEKRTRKMFNNNKRQSNIQIDINHLYNINKSKTENVFKRNMCQILFSYVNCCSAKWKRKLKILEEGRNKIYFYMDVVTYLRKMQEIDIMKYLLMSKDQKRLFDYLCKPYLNSNNIKSKIYQEYLKEEKQSFSLNKEEIEKILESYQNLLAKDNLNENEMKIIELFEEEVNNINCSIN